MSVSVRELRKSKGWSQYELAHRAEIGIQTVYRIEKGRPVLPAMARSVARTLGVSLEELPDVQVSHRVK